MWHDSAHGDEPGGFQGKQAPVFAPEAVSLGHRVLDCCVDRVGLQLSVVLCQREWLQEREP